MHKAQDGVGEFGERVSGPPWILGHRGSPAEAPENTLVSLRRAIDVGLDGVEYDLHPCATGEPVLIHDETLDRTTDASGLVGDLTLPELAGIDAGGWFHRSFVGEPLPLFDEALELPGNAAGAFPQHMIELKDPMLVSEVARRLRAFSFPISVRIASFHRSVCLEARDLGLPSMLLGDEADEDDRRFVRDERITAYGVGPNGWRAPAASNEWSCERWAWSLDDPDELLWACRAPLFGFNTNHPRRALAVRALAFLTPHDDGPYPIAIEPLEVAVLGDPEVRAEWSGRWHRDLAIRNPFAYPVAVEARIAIRGGAFEVQGLPAIARIEPYASVTVPLEIAGGSWSPALDPILRVRYVWREGPGRPEEALVLERPLARVRTLTVAEAVVRVPMLREEPDAPFASMTVRRRGGELIGEIENDGGLSDARALLRVGERVRRGGRGVRVPLSPGERAGLAAGARALSFSIGFEGRDARGTRVLRRWAGGLPYGLGSGAPGRLVLAGT